MLQEGQCLQQNVSQVAQKYGYCRQRYYQLLAAYHKGGLPALQPHKTGPKSNYRRTDKAVRQILRHRFLDPDASVEVITQKLRQTGFAMSLRSVHRVLADWEIQKKTLRAQSLPQPSPDPTGRPKHPPGPARGRRRPTQPRTRGPSTAGR